MAFLFSISFLFLTPMVKKVFLILFLALVTFSGGWFLQKYLNAANKEDTISVVLMERIKEVCKLVTVEGSFSELYTHEDYNYYNFYPFRKKALLKIRAVVTAGYDLEKINLKVDNMTKTVYISNLPDPEIMNIDTRISYYDLSEGTFNTFSNKDLTELNKEARDFIQKKAMESSLLDQAKKEGDKTLTLITVFLEQAGYKVERGTTVFKVH